MYRSLLSAVLSLSVLLSTFVAAQDASYTFTLIDAPVPHVVAFSINTRGQIVGEYSEDTPLAPVHGFLYENSVFTSLQVPGARDTFAFGINDGDQIVGSYDLTGNGDYHGVLYDKGVFTTLDVPGAIAAEAQSINNRGQIVGYYYDSSGLPHGFLYDKGGITTINVPSAIGTYAHDINNHGRIVGTYIDQSHETQLFLYDAGAFTTIDVPGELNFFSGAGVKGLGINDNNQVVGSYTQAVSYAFLYDAGVFTIIDVPGAITTYATDINNRGQIVGFYYQADLRLRSFVATPTMR